MIEFIIVFVALLIVPGSNVAFAFANGLKRESLVSVPLGFSIASGVHAATALLGVSALILNSPFLLNIVKTFGCAYLIYIAIKTSKPINNNLKSHKVKSGCYLLFIDSGFIDY
tara:strand:+ start:135 stop:473 length:339 start_codon:yes stop_codon:yes gene_type:complete